MTESFLNIDSRSNVKGSGVSQWLARATKLERKKDTTWLGKVGTELNLQAFTKLWFLSWKFTTTPLWQATRRRTMLFTFATETTCAPPNQWIVENDVRDCDSYFTGRFAEFICSEYISSFVLLFYFKSISFHFLSCVLFDSTVQI